MRKSWCSRRGRISTSWPSDGRLQHWRDAYQNGYVRIAGQDEILKLVGRVIERHEKREKTKKRRL